MELHVKYVNGTIQDSSFWKLSSIFFNRRNDKNYWELKHVSGGADARTPVTMFGQTISTFFCQLGFMHLVDIFYFIKIYDFFFQEA